MLAYAAYKFKPENILYVGIEGDFLHSLVHWSKDSDVRVEEGTDLATIRKGDDEEGNPVYEDVELKTREVVREMKGDSKVRKIFALETYEQRGEDTVCTVDKERTQAVLDELGWSGEVEWVPEDISNVIRRKVFGESMPEEEVPEWEDLAFDLVVVDLERFNGDMGNVGWAINQMYGSVMIVNGARNHPDQFMNLYSQYAGNSICVMSPLDEGCAILIREDTALTSALEE